MGEEEVMSDCLVMICKGTGARWEEEVMSDCL